MPTEDHPLSSMPRSRALETAQYIAEFAAELSFLAREARLDLLSYLLDMARLEALRTVQSRRRDGQPGTFSEVLRRFRASVRVHRSP